MTYEELEEKYNKLRRAYYSLHCLTSHFLLDLSATVNKDLSDLARIGEEDERPH